MEKHFVEFFSPGTFVAEITTKPIASWDVDAAVELAHDIVERHGARPYGFMFTTRGRLPLDLDSHEIRRSPMYYLGGTVYTREEIEARNDPKEAILRSNMRCNDIKRIVVNENSWRFTGQFHDGDVLLNVKLREK